MLPLTYTLRCMAIERRWLRQYLTTLFVSIAEPGISGSGRREHEHEARNRTIISGGPAIAQPPVSEIRSRSAGVCEGEQKERSSADMSFDTR